MPKPEFDQTITVDPCEAASAVAQSEISRMAGSGKQFEARVLFPVMHGAMTVAEQFETLGLSAAETHRLHSHLAYDTLMRLRDDGSLDPDDQIRWRQTDTIGEEWVEYVNGSGVEFAVNCPGLRFGIGQVDKNRRGRSFDRLMDRSYPYEPDYEIVRTLFDMPEHYRADAEAKQRRSERIKRAIGPVALAGIAVSAELINIGIHRIYS